MKKAEVEDAIASLWVLVRDHQPIIIGSQSLHGKFPDVADTILYSREVDVILPNKTKLAAWISDVVGEGTPFDVDRGYFIDHVVTTPNLPILAEGWKERAISEKFYYDGSPQGTVLYLSPEDMAISKLGAGREKDFVYVSELLKKGYIQFEDLEKLIPQLLNAVHREKVQAGLSKLTTPAATIHSALLEKNIGVSSDQAVKLAQIAKNPESHGDQLIGLKAEDLEKGGATDLHISPQALSDMLNDTEIKAERENGTVTLTGASEVTSNPEKEIAKGPSAEQPQPNKPAPMSAEHVAPDRRGM